MLKAIIYQSDKTQKQTRSAALLAPAPDEEMRLIQLLPEEKGQTLLGFGGAFTEAAAWNYMGLDDAGKERALDALFSENGANFTLGRLHIGASDFSLGSYEYVRPGDETLESFDISREKTYVLPFVRDAARRSGGRLSLLASPWSPPFWMKDTKNALHGGRLLPEYYGLYARYIVQYVLRMRAEGAPIDYLTVQNEPNAAQTWESCRFTAREEGAFAADFLRPALDQAGLSGVKLLIWDHNKERLLERALQSYAAPGAGNALYGAAYHWYTGDHFEQIRLLRQKRPDKHILGTEGCEGMGDGPDDFMPAVRYAHSRIGDLNAGSEGFIDWNLLLNQDCGPYHDRAGLCLAPILKRDDSDSFTLTGAYYGQWHVSRFLRPGARMIACSAYSPDIDAAAAVNPDGSVGLVLANRADRETEVHPRLNAQSLALTLPKKSVCSLLISQA